MGLIMGLIKRLTIMGLIIMAPPLLRRRVAKHVARRVAVAR